jgi:hypothetical protein
MVPSLASHFIKKSIIAMEILKKSLYIVLHVYKGNNGETLAARYLEIFMDLIGNEHIPKKLFIFFYEFPKNEEKKVISLFAGLACSSTEAKYVFSGNCFSEVPTLRQAKEICAVSEDEDLLLYFHSKGASNNNQENFINWSEYAISVLAAAVKNVWFHPFLIDKYYAIGSFAGVGVFERYGIMTPAFSGNFWLTKATRFCFLDIKTNWFSDSYHNRHYAEALLAKEISAERLLNLEDNYYLRSISKPNTKEIFNRVCKELLELNSASEEELNYIDNYICYSYKGLVEQQERYSSSRYFWVLRKLLFGNQSVLRFFPSISKIMDRLSPWSQCELYRHYTGSKQVDILRNIRAVK